MPRGKSNKTCWDLSADTQGANEENHSSSKKPSRAPGLGGSAPGEDTDSPQSDLQA